MTLSLRIYDDTESVSFQDQHNTLAGPDARSSWFMAPNVVNTQSLISYSLVEGPSVAERSRGLLAENIPLWMQRYENYGSLKEGINKIERLIEKSNHGRPVWLEYNDHRSDDNLWRSPVLAGAFAMTNQTLLDLREGKAAMFASITRQPWWEGEERETNLSGTVLSNGVPVSFLDTNDVGVMPTPPKLTFTKTGSSSSPAVRMYVFQKHNTSATRQTYRVGSVTGRTFSSTEVVTTMAALDMSSLSDGWYRVWLGGSSASSMSTLRNASLWRWATGASNAVVDMGFWTQAGHIGGHQSRYTDLGSIRVGQRTHLYIQSMATAAHTSPPQQVYLLPTDGYRELFVAASIPRTGVLIDDGIEQELGGSVSATAQAYGEPLIMSPGQYSEMVVLAEDSSGNTVTGFNLTSNHRPRRSTI